MDRVGVRELKQNASAVLRRVEAGESIEITDRGRPIARLVPLQTPSGLERLIAMGRVIPARGDRSRLLRKPSTPAPGRALPSQVLAKLRAGES